MEEVRTPEVLGELIEERASRLGDKIFLRFKDQNFSYREMDRFSNRCANAFKSLGVTKGDTVSIMLANCPEFIHLWFGLGENRSCGSSGKHVLQGRILAPHRRSVRFENLCDRQRISGSSETDRG